MRPGNIGIDWVFSLNEAAVLCNAVKMGSCWDLNVPSPGQVKATALKGQCILQKHCNRKAQAQYCEILFFFFCLEVMSLKLQTTIKKTIQLFGPMSPFSLKQKQRALYINLLLTQTLHNSMFNSERYSFFIGSFTSYLFIMSKSNKQGEKKAKRHLLSPLCSYLFK